MCAKKKEGTDTLVDKDVKQRYGLNASLYLFYFTFLVTASVTERNVDGDLISESVNLGELFRVGR